MADGLEINLGIGKFNVRKGIETTHMEILKEQRPKAYVLRLCKEVEIFVDYKNIECHEHSQCHEHLWPFFMPYPKNIP